ncbi:MAG: ATP-binding protein [Tepidisphaeraceae bacterium]|jgi:hypothetical protein
MSKLKQAPDSEVDGERSIDVTPTKELFIDMLTRDIALIPAIIDLVDNSADGAKRLRGSDSFKGLWARIEIGPEGFRIADNCGGISTEVAEKYAFRFGRPPGAPTVKHSVGQFGVGMKRAIFKMGRRFRVESSTSTSRFAVEINVEEWAKTVNWTFPFAELNEDIKVDKEDAGTTISVTALRRDVADAFRLENFETELKNELQSRLQDPISNGLVVTLNQVPVTAQPLSILADPRLAPAYKKLRYPESGPKPVTVKLYCGLGQSEDRAAAGWHVFCNGRLILEGDKSDVTGWGEDANGISIPGFHGQYNHLRGYAYFDADDSGKLPWNTTKTGINTDSDVYRAAKLEMMHLMRPVVDFLNRLKIEKDQKEEGDVRGPLERLIDGAKTAVLARAETREVFEMPRVRTAPAKPGPVMQRIQYSKPLADVRKAMSVLKASTYTAVGEKTFGTSE